MNYLIQYADPGLTVREGETPETIAAAEVERLVKLHAVATQAQAVPRRAGDGASSEDMATDKKRSRRIAHVAMQLMGNWGGKMPESHPSYAREAAQVVWETWWADHQVYLANRRRYIATWAMHGGNDRWAKSAVVRINNEINWLAYAMRD